MGDKSIWISSISNFPAFYTVLLTTVTMLGTSSLDLTVQQKQNSVPLGQHLPHLPHLPLLVTTALLLTSTHSIFLDSIHKRDHAALSFCAYRLFHLAWGPAGSSMCCKWQNLLLCKDWIMSPCNTHNPFICSFFNRCLGSFPVLAVVNSAAVSRGHRYLFKVLISFPLGSFPIKFRVSCLQKHGLNS